MRPSWAPSRSSAGPRGHRAAELRRPQRTLRAGRLSFLPATKTALGRGSGSGSGGQDPSTARVLSHPRSETRLRRTQRSRARRAAPHLGQCRAPPRAVPQRRTQARGLLAATTACPRPFPPRRMRAPQPQLPPGWPWVTKKSPAPALVWVSGQLPPALYSIGVRAARPTKHSLFMGQWNRLTSQGRLESL